MRGGKVLGEPSDSDRMDRTMDGQILQMFDGFMKRDGMVVPFRRDKIVCAISRAAGAAVKAE